MMLKYSFCLRSKTYDKVKKIRHFVFESFNSLLKEHQSQTFHHFKRNYIIINIFIKNDITFALCTQHLIHISAHISRVNGKR